MKYFTFYSPLIAILISLHSVPALARGANIALSDSTFESSGFDLAHYNDKKQVDPLLTGTAAATNPVASETPPPEPDQQSVEGPKLPPDIVDADKIESSTAAKFKMPKDIKYIQLGFLAVNAADTALTIYCVEKGLCREMNPLYGSHPSPLRIVGVKAATVATQYILVRELAKTDPGIARVVAIATLAGVTGVVGYNATVIF